MKNSTFDDISAVAGWTATVKLQVWFSGRYVYIPSVASPSHPLARLLGLSVLAALVREFGGPGDRALWIPSECAQDRFRRDRDIAVALANGTTVQELAERFGLTVRRVEQIREELQGNGVIVYAEGYRKAMRRHRRPGDRGYAASVPTIILKTGEVSGRTPLPKNRAVEPA